MFAMLKTGKMERFMSDLEILGLLVACLCHDLDHRGTNNAFQTKTESPLAILYSTSTMEHHHFDQCVMILNSESNNIFQALSPCDYKDVMRVVETAILSTDLAMYFKKKSKFLELVDNGEFDWQSPEKKESSNEAIKDVELTVTTLNCTKPVQETSNMALVKKTYSLRRPKPITLPSRPPRNKFTR
ncbi:cGMP-specific 3',5'-cyclic phosphodiesterase [Papilio machaon]|uniref:cGMP-specific 3',5'-cyclic phosphodiesterase n=1 Tax=Papilio machaon TaxID=76193 RepID=A0A0N1ICZ0_PAPMA|nr:cGMP-specific 3',5'-cyclic phosphodiesterase [Papilio machaon]